MKKRFLSIFTALALCMSLLPQMAWAEEPLNVPIEEEEGTIEEELVEELVEEPVAAAPMTLETQGSETGVAVQAATPVSDETALKNAIANGGEVVLQGNITLTSTLTISSTVTLDLGGNTLRGNGSDYVVKITSGGTLTLKDSGTNMYAAITGNGGVYVDGGAFNMNGGAILNSKAENGGGVYVASGTFTLEGGTIDACEAENGGGVYVAGGVFNLKRGNISGGATKNGGGVYVANGGEFNMDGGDIMYSTATDNGGGAYIENGGTMTMNGGSISSGYRPKGDSYGIYLAGTLNANGGTVGSMDKTETVTVAADGKILTTGGGSGTTFTASVLNNGTIRGGTFSNTVTNQSMITNGTFTETVTNEGTITDGTFNGEVTNNADGKINGGTFAKDATVTNNGTITDGTFNGDVTNNANGKINGGTFAKDATVTNNGTIEDGSFAEGATVTNDGTIKDGSFAVGSTVTNDGTIEDGKFHGTVKNNGKIESGEFNGEVTNNADGEITNGTFKDVTNNGTISGGTFEGEISGKGTVSFTDDSKTLYTVKFMADTTVHETKYVTSLDAKISASADNPAKTGYTFEKWTYGGTEWKFEKTISENGVATSDSNTITLTAVFKQDAKQDSGNSGSSGGGGGKRTETKLDGKKYAEDGALSIDGIGGFVDITGFEIDGKSLDRFDCSGLDLRMSTGNTWMKFTPEAMKQLVDSNAESLILVNGDAELKLPRAVLQQLLAQMGDEKLRVLFLTDEDVLNSLSTEQRKTLDRTLKNAGCRLIGAVTGEFMIGNRPVDWSKNRVEMEVSSPFLTPVTEEELMQWMEEMRQEMLDWRSEPEDRSWLAPDFRPELVEWKSLPDISELEDWSFGLKPDEDDEDIFRFEIYPPEQDKKPYVSPPYVSSYTEIGDDWDEEDIKASFQEDLSPAFEPNEKGDYFARFQVKHFSTYLLLARPVEQAGEETKADTAQSFADVDQNAYYYDAVQWAAENDVTGGTGEGKFNPNAACTRAQIVTFLWRAVGSPEAKDASGFSDVAQDAYYAKAVAWAVENGITGGTGEGKFSPNATCTRAQAVSFLHRAADRPEASAAAAFTDVAQDAYYAKAVAWAAENDVTGGVGGGLFGANADCTRAQIVTFLYRAAQ